ncbi:DUF4345 domain-containing protein [Tenacibaculum sp. M341]|uniref:DUF4345 domain-containing protein n=1 Tax=Tenacibaculum sp. M341 TaxID=2530339 RepID=UPI001FB413C6|nr:DUF4345 domain-containing protein [Tenacibaculum sp. M341]
MFLYLGISIVWFVGILKLKYWKIATQLNILFMLTLGVGRLFSMLVDGVPSNGYIFGVVAELVLGAFSVYQLKRYNLKNSVQ